MLDEHSLLAFIDLLAGVGNSGLLLLVIALLVRGDVVPRSALKAIVAETVAETIDQLSQRRTDQD